MRGDHINDPVNISSDESADSSSDEAVDTSSDERAYSSSDDGVDTSSDEGIFSNGKHQTFNLIKCGHDLHFSHLRLWAICLLNY